MVGEFAGGFAGDLVAGWGKGAWAQWGANVVGGTAAEFAISWPDSVGEASTNIVANTAAASLDALLTRAVNPVNLVMGGLGSAHPSVGRSGRLPNLLSTTLELSPALFEGSLNLAAPQASDEINTMLSSSSEE
jgi:hypothetical protein